MTTTTSREDLAPAAASLQESSTAGQASTDWEAEARRLRAERDEARADLATLRDNIWPFDDAIGEIFTICLDHVPEDFTCETVDEGDEGTLKDYQATARNVIAIVRAALGLPSEGGQEAPEAKPLPDWDDTDFEPATMDHDTIYVGQRKYLASDIVEVALDKAREDALREAQTAVNGTASPIAGTPYSAGGRLFSQAIEARLAHPRPQPVSAPASTRARDGR